MLDLIDCRIPHTGTIGKEQAHPVMFANVTADILAEVAQHHTGYVLCRHIIPMTEAVLFLPVPRAHNAQNKAGIMQTADQAAILLHSQSLGVSRSICIDAGLRNFVMLTSCRWI